MPRSLNCAKANQPLRADRLAVLWSAAGTKLDFPTPVSWLWEAACVIHVPVDAPKLKEYALMVGELAKQ